MAYTISQMAQRFGVEPHTLRFYEKEGIIQPERTPSGIRSYTEENVAQLEMAMCLKSTGMPLREIKKYFDLVEQGDESFDLVAAHGGHQAVHQVQDALMRAHIAGQTLRQQGDLHPAAVLFIPPP